MDGKQIKTKLTLDGEKEFRKQIASINQELRLGNAQLKETAAAYDLNGNAQERLTANSRILREQLNAQNRIVADYEERLRQAKQATDLSAEGLRNYEIALTAARTKQKQLEKQVEDTDRELEELGRDSRRAGSQLEDNLVDAADDVSNRFERMVKDIDDSLSDIRSMQGVSLAVDLVRGAWDVGQRAYQWAQGYAQENMKTAMAQYNVQTAGGNWEQTARLAIQFASIFGDKDSALEAISNLTAAGYTDTSLEKMAQYLGGAAIRWQDTLKIESLADSLQESLSEGVLTGQFGELINRLTEITGITQEQVAEQLAEAKKYGQEKETIEAYLRDAGLDKTYEGFTDQNQAMIDAAVSAETLNQELAELTGTVTVLITPAIRGLAKGSEWINDKIKEIKESENPAVETTKKAVSGGAAIVESVVKEIVETTYEITGTEKPTGQKANPIVQAYVEEEIARWIAEEKRNKLTQAQRDAMMLASGQSNYAASLYVKPLETIATEVDAQLTQTEKTAEEGGSKIGGSLIAGLQGQTAGLLAIAEQQRALIEAVWDDPITPTVVVSYGTAPGATGGKPNLPTLPSSVNVTVELDKRKLGQTIVPLVDAAMGGATGADVKKIY